MIRNLLYTLVLLMVTNLAIGQIEISPDEFAVVATGQDFEEFRFDVINNGSEAVGLYWKLFLAEDFPAAYSAQVCDINICYNWGSYQSATSAAAANNIDANSSVPFIIKVKDYTNHPEYVPLEEDTHVILKLYSDPEFTNEVATSRMPTVSTNDLDLTDLVIFPNPTTDIFQLKNDESISEISLFNIVGREVARLDHTSGQVHDVSSLRTGMYLVRLHNQKGEVLKSMRLSKR